MIGAHKRCVHVSVGKGVESVRVCGVVILTAARYAATLYFVSLQQVLRYNDGFTTLVSVRYEL